AAGRDAVLTALRWALLLLLSACAVTPEAEKITLMPVSFVELPGWAQDKQSEAVPALVRSCAVTGKKENWHTACDALANLPPGDDVAARALFEKYFQAYAASGNAGDEGLFTGYYEAELRGSLKREGPYQTPLFARPADLVTVDLGDFKPTLKN